MAPLSEKLYTPVAQLVEHRIPNPRVGSSSLSGRAIFPSLLSFLTTDFLPLKSPDLDLRLDPDLTNKKICEGASKKLGGRLPDFLA